MNFQQMFEATVVQKLIIPAIVIGFLIYLVYLLSTFGTRLSREKARIYRTPEGQRSSLGLLLLKPTNSDAQQDAEYRTFYRHQCAELVMKSAVVWAIIFVLTRI